MDPYTQLLQSMLRTQELVFQLAETYGITREELLQRALDGQEAGK